MQESQANSTADARTDDGVLSGGEGGGAEFGAVQPGVAQTGRAPGCQPGGGSVTPKRDPGARSAGILLLTQQSSFRAA